MSITSGFAKIKKYKELGGNIKKLISYWTSYETVECDNNTTLKDKLEVMINSINDKASTSHATSSTKYGVSTSINYGHSKAATATPSAASASGGVGTDNGIYARGDHSHPEQTTVIGNSGTATALANTRYIDGIGFNGGSNVTRFGTCSTPAATAIKTVVLEGFKLVTGARVIVKFAHTNTAISPTLNVNNTGAKYMFHMGNGITGESLCLKTGGVYEFVYDGTYYQLIDGLDANSICEKIELMGQRVDSLNTNLADSGWIYVTTFSNGFGANASTVAKYRKIGKIVEIRGELLTPAGAAINNAAGLTVFTLPTGYRPSGETIFAISFAGTVSQCLLKIYSSGAVMISRFGSNGSFAPSVAANTWIPISIMFMID